MERKYTQSTHVSWVELSQKIGALAGSIITKKYVAFVTAADIESNIGAHMLAELIQAEYHPNAIGSRINNSHAIIFKLDNHGLQFTEGMACLTRYIYEDETYNTLLTPEFYLDEVQVELDTRPLHIIYPWKI